MNKKLIALLAAASMVLSTGSVAFADGEAEPIKELNNYVTDPTYLTPNTILKGTNSIHLQITANYIEGFTEMDCNSQMIPAAAAEYYTEDNGVTWTFKLKEGLKWVNCEGEEMADYIAQDFITGLEVVMNYWKNDTANTLIPKNTIVGAEDYYEWTKNLDEEEAMALDTTKFLEMVGIEAPDDHTVIYHCLTNVPYFVSATASPSFYPLSQSLIDACGDYAAVEAAEWTDLWYSGPYYISDFLAGNFIQFSPNPHYWDTESTRFDKVTYLVVSDNTLAYSLYENGEIDRVQLPTATLKSIVEDENHRRDSAAAATFCEEIHQHLS